MINKKIGIIGCGNMGEALIVRLSRMTKGAKNKLIASDLDRVKIDRIRTRYKILATDDNKKLTDYSDIIILAVKPKDFDIVLKEISGNLSKKKLLISIAAGITTKYIEKLSEVAIPVIRAMPNMPAVIGEAISSISRGSFATAEHLGLAKDIFSSIGDVVEVEEGLVDGITAVSGSGPAYFFYLIESLIEAAEELGLNKETAKSIVLKTAFGSSKLLEVLKGQPSDLRAKVTSKGGTTEAAFKVLESKNFKEIVKEAVRQAYVRSKELSKD